jgi:hypothetical protein
MSLDQSYPVADGGSFLVWCWSLVRICNSVEVPGQSTRQQLCVYCPGDHGPYNNPDTLSRSECRGGIRRCVFLALGDMN